MTKPRLGHINFLNVLPLTYSFQNSNTAEGINLSCGVPAIMNNDLMNGRLDVSEVSSIVYAKNHEKTHFTPLQIHRKTEIIYIRRDKIWELV